MKYCPQTIICPCGFQGRIIMEDIALGSLKYHNEPSPEHIVVCLTCPSCHNSFRVTLEYCSTHNEETLFECNIEPNVGLQMWRRIENGLAKPPVFDPRSMPRSDLEQTLDATCREKIDKIVKWKNTPQQGNTLNELLSDIEDYTKTKTWKNFNKRHYIMSVCDEKNSSGADCFTGFNGRFDTVIKKSPVLITAFRSKLGGKAEDLPNHFCSNKIGHCAEMHTANLCLEKNGCSSLGDLVFSIAYNCRTAMPRSYCLNCLTIFDLTNDG